MDETTVSKETKFCQHCGETIDKDCIICPKCGKQVQDIQQPNVVIQNTNTTTVVHHGRERNKWTAFWLCLLLGPVGAHKFYEGKAGMGILYILTGGLFLIGWIVDLITILTKPNPYYV